MASFADFQDDVGMIDATEAHYRTNPCSDAGPGGWRYRFGNEAPQTDRRFVSSAGTAAGLTDAKKRAGSNASVQRLAKKTLPRPAFAALVDRHGALGF